MDIAHAVDVSDKWGEEMRLIDADALIMAVEDFPNCYNGWSDTYDKAFIIGAIEEAPTIDAVSVVHGEWKPFDLTWGRSLYACSVCGEVEYLPCDAFNGKPLFKYCPNCGAKMDGERKESE